MNIFNAVVVIMAFGVRQSVIVSNICAIINIVIVTFIVIVGATKGQY